MRAQWGSIVTEKRENRCQKESLFAHNVLMTVLGLIRRGIMLACACRLYVQVMTHISTVCHEFAFATRPPRLSTKKPYKHMTPLLPLQSGTLPNTKCHFLIVKCLFSLIKAALCLPRHATWALSRHGIMTHSRMSYACRAYQGGTVRRVVAGRA